MNPGDARRIFINDATDGTPRESGRTWDLGLDDILPLGQRSGGEYYFSSRLTGHDTSYSPDGDDVNRRRDYTYPDADDAVGQPTCRPVVLVGVGYRLGG